MKRKRTALVTGSSRGIGRAIALKLAGQGFNIVINYLPDPAGKNLEEAQSVKEEASAEGADAIVAGADVSSQGEVKRMAEEIIGRYGNLDILVNNAGILLDRTLRKMERQAWDAVISVNLGSVYNCCRAFVNGMIDQNYGRIINISSVVAFTGNYGQTNYAASKSGIVGFTKSLALEVAGKGVTVNAVAPGIIETDMIMGVPEKYRKKLVEKIPMGKMGSPEDISKAVAFFAGEDSDYITGQVLHVNGGYYL